MSRLSLEVWGDLACFSRPDLGKVERFSYPIITPSAARAIFDAIYWKPRFRWQVTEIELLAPARYIGLLRNEVQRKAPDADTILRWASGQAEPQPLLAGAGSDIGTPRQTMALKNVCYRLHAEPRLWERSNGHAERVAIVEQFRRRARAGQCVHQPYLGCREFPAYFRLLDAAEASERSPQRQALDQKLGWMLYDVFDLSRPDQNNTDTFISAFDAVIVDGVLTVPPFEDARVKKPRRRDAADA